MCLSCSIDLVSTCVNKDIYNYNERCIYIHACIMPN